MFVLLFPGKYPVEIKHPWICEANKPILYPVQWPKSPNKWVVRVSFSKLQKNTEEEHMESGNMHHTWFLHIYNIIYIYLYLYIYSSVGAT